MDLIALTIIITAIVFKLKKSKKLKKNKVIKSQGHISKHGHRCYIDQNLTNGELTVVNILAENLNHKEYFIFNNLIIPSSVNDSTQIDHVVVSRFGIFVIENKDMSGWIFANKNRNSWTQTTKRGRKYKFQNPLWQNFGHVSALKEHMAYVKNSFISVIAFSDFSEFKTEKPEGVVFYSGLVNLIQGHSKPILKEVELLVVIGKLSMLCQSADISSEQHVQNLAKVHSAAQVVSVSY